MIYGKRIRLRRPEKEDLPLFVRWLNDPEVQAGISMYLPIGMAEEEKWFEKMLERPVAEHGAPRHRRHLATNYRSGTVKASRSRRTRMSASSASAFSWRNLRSMCTSP